MAQCFGALVSLTEDLGLIPSTHKAVTHNYVTVDLGHPVSSSDLSGYQACMWYTDVHGSKTFTHVN